MQQWGNNQDDVFHKTATEATMAMTLKIYQTSLTSFDAIDLFWLKEYYGFNINYT